jgi:hypothetical protein
MTTAPLGQQLILENKIENETKNKTAKFTLYYNYDMTNRSIFFDVILLSSSRE